MTDPPLPLVHVARVEVIGDHRLRLGFEDGTVGDVAFDEHEWRGVFEPLADQAFFAQVRVESGTIAWPNGVDMAPEPLYEEATRHPAAPPTARHRGDRL
ncbi:MAG: hypothetical protein QOJ63_1714 [Solirubrobacteraceae bacterium]|jgi:hypothetical protein|nr:hypothetical protein [Solirubrobacteraceae bacterium]